MKLLLDENLPHQLRREIPGHDCYTIAFQCWGGKRNGELLELAEEAGFEAMLTKDSNIPYQQNPTTLPIAIVVLEAATNDIEDIRPLLPKLLAALTNLSPRQVTVVG